MPMATWFNLISNAFFSNEKEIESFRQESKLVAYRMEKYQKTKILFEFSQLLKLFFVLWHKY